MVRRNFTREIDTLAMAGEREMTNEPV